MASAQRQFAWYELMTTDIDAAKSFYSNIIGWGTQAPPSTGIDYTLFTTAEAPVAGMMTLPDSVKAMGVPPCWTGYIGVDDVDATVAAVKRLGGHVRVEPMDIPSVGRFAVVADPQGAVFALLAWLKPGSNGHPEAGSPGRVGWHELLAVDWEKAFGFYSELFGWEKGESHDIGAMGTYQLFTVNGQPIGGMFNKPPMVPVPFWLYYVNVKGVDAAAERVKAGGGQIVNGPMEVPGGSWIVQCFDPQHAMFALVGTRN